MIACSCISGTWIWNIVSRITCVTVIHIHEMIVSSVTSEYMKYNVQCNRVSIVLDDTSTDNNNFRVTVYNTWQYPVCQWLSWCCNNIEVIYLIWICVNRYISVFVITFLVLTWSLSHSNYIQSSLFKLSTTIIRY